MLKLIRRLYDWVLSWADSRYSTWALGGLAFAESSFFPVPPDVLLLALAIAKPKRSFFYALIASVGSVIGGLGGYLIGIFLFEAIGRRILQMWGYMEIYEELVEHFRNWAFLSVLAAALTPIPYKVFTIAGGVARLHLGVFLLASALGRFGRFFTEGLLIFLFGKPVKDFIEKYFNLLTILFIIALVGGFVILKYLIRTGV